LQKSERGVIKRDPHIKPFLDKKAKELSGGERRLIEIKLVMHSNSRYILIDEPFNGVEPLLKEDVKSEIQQHSKERVLYSQTTIIKTSLIWRQNLSYCTMVKQGKLETKMSSFFMGTSRRHVEW
jgi:ABC-type lipopolysaccharide export system ATPase subunit